MSMPDTLIVRNLGRQPYEPVWRAMQHFNAERDETNCDELWLVEHDPVFTLGMNGKPEHLLNPGDIPVVPIDRGGQVTYHGPGQVVAYLMVNLKRRKLGVREMVQRMEQAVIDLLAEYNISAYGRRDAPGVYVDEKKIAALGLRVRRGGSYHGLALNVAMDLNPYERINPCGYAGMEITQVGDLGGPSDTTVVADALVGHLARTLGYNETRFEAGTPI